MPRDSLPLQTTLHFRPPAAELAQAYLAAVATVHGVESDIGRLYERSLEPLRPELVNQPLPPNGNEPNAQFDLRAALTQLQLDRSAPAELGAEEAELVGELDALLLRLDATSFADAYIAPRAWARLEVGVTPNCTADPNRSTRSTALRPVWMTSRVSRSCSSRTCRSCTLRSHRTIGPVMLPRHWSPWRAGGARRSAISKLDSELCGDTPVSTP